MNFTLSYQGRALSVSWRQKNVKHMHLHVEADGSVWVSSPMGTPKGQVEAFVKAHAGWIAIKSAKAAPPPGYVFWMGETVAAFPDYETEAKAYLTGRFHTWCQRMGVSPALRFQVTKTRYGCCIPARNQVCLHPGLIAAPRTCIDYVIVHELTHLLIPNHSAAFHQKVAEWIPDEKALRGVLAQYNLPFGKKSHRP